MILHSSIETYLDAHVGDAPEAFRKLWKKSQWEMVYGHMVSDVGQAQFLRLMAQLMGARKVLDVGTFTGQSALAFAFGVGENGRVITLEKNEEHWVKAQRLLQEYPESNRISFHCGDALMWMKESSDVFDLIFIDAEKQQYDAYYEAALVLLRSGGLIIVDNVLWYGTVADPTNQQKDAVTLRQFNQKIAEDSRVTSVILPLRDGLTLIQKK
jgi:predicted O-methyltransferase YrrM